jgi:hypothetical protein
MPLSNGQRICNAHRRDGLQCGQVAVTGKSKCKMHGGNAVSGVLHGRFKHGRYSKDLPTQLALRAAEARGNPALLSLADELAVLEARKAELLRGLETGDSGETWRRLQQTFTEFSAAQGRGDVDAMQSHFTTLQALVKQGASAATAWREIQRLMETQAKLVQVEVKTLQGLQQLVTVGQMELQMGAVTNVVIQAVKRHCDTACARAVLQDVQDGFTRLATLEPR